MIAAVHRICDVLENVRLARDTYRVRLAAPEIAASIVPGQFVMLRICGTSDPLLGRPFALYDTVLEAGEPVGIDIVYLVVGKMTGRLAQLRAADRLEIWGPLGHGFRKLTGVSEVALVAGGIGQTPFLAAVRDMLGTRGYGGQPAKRQVDRVRLCYGVRTADLAAGVEDFRAAGAIVHLATDDGTRGWHGYVVELLAAQPRPDHLVGCGPEPMMRALARLARDWNVPCDLSLETPMACGLGICFGCVTKIRTPTGGWDYQRVCVDGPVFDARLILWDAEREQTD
jgi:dihydroorotate dehydrogenase electron transfer subunit